jgi:hypothetical protein
VERLSLRIVWDDQLFRVGEAGCGCCVNLGPIIAGQEIAVPEEAQPEEVIRLIAERLLELVGKRTGGGQ